ncbi:MAG: DegQ family serine endoprotease [Acetobacteraceae bacterium]|nr:DegQ family serine endoprotease [Acetobacteraceae bacterium]
MTAAKLCRRAAAVLLAATPLAFATPAPPAAAQPALSRSAPESFADLAARLVGAVVNVSTTQNVQTAQRERQGPDIPQAPPGSPFEEFFRDFFGQRPQPGQPPGQGPGQRGPRRAQSLGSGFIIQQDANGAAYVVTNNHVIDGADEITVRLSDNTQLRATLAGKDQRTDLALLRVQTEKRLTTVPWGNSDTARVGDWVLAIGNPFGLGGSVTAGIVSARGRDINQGPYDDFIQTDAAINRGNSGGPLFNMAGEVVGINTAIYSPSGGSIGIGFAIPSNLAQHVVQQLREHGRTRRGWLGVRIQGVTDEIAESVGLHGGGRGALIAGINEGGPADKGRLQNGDIVLRFDGTDIREMRNLPRVVADTAIGKQVPVLVWRDGAERTLQVTVGELPEDQQQAAATPGPQDRGGRVVDVPGTGMKVAAISQELRERFSLREDQRGVVITDVAQGSPAADRGIRAGDVIVEVSQESVATPAEVLERVERARAANRRNVLMLIESTQGGLRWVPLPAAKG